MIDFMLCFLASLLVAVPISIGLGVFYFFVAATIVDVFRLNYGERPIGFLFLNAALALTFLSYVLAVAFLMRSM